MPSPNTIKRRALEPRRNPSYLGPYRYVRDEFNKTTQCVRSGWTPGMLVTSRDRNTTYKVAPGGNLVRVK